MTSLEEQLYAARGFWAQLAEQPGSDANASLLHVLETYQQEIQRQLDGTCYSEEWLGILALASMAAKFLSEELLELTLGLDAYSPEDEPQSTNEMTIRLLADAVKLFDATVDGRVYLDIPEVAIEIDKFVKRVLEAQETE